MKVLFLCALFLVSNCGKRLNAQEGNNPEVKPESDISSSTKKVLRKIGRKSMDTTCELTKGKEECEKEKLQHQQAAKADEADTKKRKMKNEITKKSKRESKIKRKEKQAIEEKECLEKNGKLECTGKKIKDEIENIVP